MSGKAVKTCAVCKRTFEPASNRQKYCAQCGEVMKWRASGAAKRRSEEREREEKRSTAIWH